MIELNLKHMCIKWGRSVIELNLKHMCIKWGRSEEAKPMPNARQSYLWSDIWFENLSNQAKIFSTKIEIIINLKFQISFNMNLNRH